ncbi:MAG: RNA 2',3'-cyclic phosphodiesterase [Desulfobacterales bacterium]|jgi:2'-5' RNA ligase|nr:RNA 2',3'-cyclic phosphodiesterase [Desulfobacterales bacterium]
MKLNPTEDHNLRAFIAVELPENVRSALRLVQEKLNSYQFKITWTKPENIHLTMKFLGDIKQERVAPIVSVLESAARDCRPMTLCSQAIGFFPGVRQPRVLWTGISGQTEALAELQGKIDRGLASLNIPREKKPFTGHLTLGRIKGGGNPGMFVDIMKTFQNMKTDPFMVDSVNLYQSNLMPSGPIYSKLFTMKLGSA